ncbi:CBS domain-containing protein [Thermodesulfovibrio hydrogeniphilus]
MNLKVKDIMNNNIETISQESSVFEAMQKMVSKKIRSLLVPPKDEKDVYGIITVRDIVYNVICRNLDLHKTKVGEVATKRIVCINKDPDLQDFIKLMEKFNVGRGVYK